MLRIHQERAECCRRRACSADRHPSPTISGEANSNVKMVRHGDFANVRLSGAHLRGADLIEAKLDAADLRRINLRNGCTTKKW